VTAANAEGITTEDDNITNIQTLALADLDPIAIGKGTLGATLRADLIGDEITAVNLEEGTAGAYTIRFNAGDNTLTTFADTFGLLNVQAEGTATTDALTLNIDGTAGVNDVTVVSLTLNNVDRPIEQLTINSTDAATGHTIAGAVTLPTTAGVNNAITITGNSNLTIVGAVTADEIDASGMTNGAGLTMFPGSTSTIAISITGSGGDDRLVGSTFRDSISGAGGNDNITGGTGTDQLTGGDGGDTFVQAANASAVASATNGVAGTAFTAAQTITFAPVGTSAVPNVDIISGFTGGVNGDILDLGSPTAAVSGIGTANNALVAGTNYFLSGNFTTGTGVFTITSDGGGADTLIIQGNGGPIFAANASSIVLAGFNSNNLVGANII
jgi:Ca2+-binding RTX toxin-like protein